MPQAASGGHLEHAVVAGLERDLRRADGDGHAAADGAAAVRRLGGRLAADGGGVGGVLMAAAARLAVDQQADGGGRPPGLCKVPELEAQVRVPGEGGGLVQVGAAAAQLVEGGGVSVTVERD